MLGGNSVHLGETELPRLDLSFAPLLAVDLVRGHDRVGAGFPGRAGRRAVAGQHAGRRVHHEDDEVRLADCRERLVPDRLRNRFLSFRIEAARIHQEVGPVVGEAGLDLEHVARHAGQVVDERPPPSEQPVEERGLPHVGPPCDYDGELTHRGGESEESR